MQQSQPQFREDEIITMTHWDKQGGVQVTTPYPKIGGRLRIAHENNDQLSITSKVFSYDGQVAVVVATTTTDKGTYNGVGMASRNDNRKLTTCANRILTTPSGERERVMGASPS